MFLQTSLFRRVFTGIVILTFGGAVTARAQSINQTFTFTGSNQIFVVPSDVTSVFVRLWGAGGGPGISGFGGGGAFVSGNLRVTPGDQLTLLVGGSGGLGQGGFGGGGNGGGGGGGGRSGILLNGIELVDAGGGGGGATGYNGGAGGVSAGMPGGGNAKAGGGGTQGAGGTGGMGIFSGSAGSQFQGGAGSTIFGGAGGGGYYGGGGGGADSFGSNQGAGGGGSSYITNSMFNLTQYEDGAGGLPGGYGLVAGRLGYPFYILGVGVSNPNFISGTVGNGEIVISYDSAAVPESGELALLLGLGAAGLLTYRRGKRSR